MKGRLSTGEGEMLKAISLGALKDLIDDHHIEVTVGPMPAIKAVPASQVAAIGQLYCYPCYYIPTAAERKSTAL